MPVPMLGRQTQNASLCCISTGIYIDTWIMNTSSTTVVMWHSIKNKWQVKNEKLVSPYLEGISLVIDQYCPHFFTSTESNTLFMSFCYIYITSTRCYPLRYELIICVVFNLYAQAGDWAPRSVNYLNVRLLLILKGLNFQD